MIKEKKTVMSWRRYLTVYKNSGIEVLSHIQTDWRIDMADGTITAKQKEILEYIKSEILKRGFPPAVREICEAVHLKSTSSVHSHLESLERKGYIRRDPTKPRAIEILDDSFQLLRKEMVNVPIVGKIAAGSPLLAVENIESYFPIPSEYPDIFTGGKRRKYDQCRCALRGSYSCQTAGYRRKRRDGCSFD